MGLLIAISFILIVSYVSYSIYLNIKEIKRRPISSNYLQHTSEFTQKIYNITTQWEKLSYSERMEEGIALQEHISKQKSKWKKETHSYTSTDGNEQVLSPRHMEIELIFLFWEAVHDLYCAYNLTDAQMVEMYNDGYLPLKELFKPRAHEYVVVKSLTEKPS